MDDFRPAMQYAITGQVANAAGHSSPLALYPTIHRTPDVSIDERRLVRKSTPGALDQFTRATLQSGLAWTLRRGDTQDASRARLAAWQVAANEAPASALKAEPWTGQLIGWLQIPDHGAFEFRAEGVGLQSFTLDGKTVSMTGDGWSRPITLGRGYFPITVDVASRTDGTAAGRLLWRSEIFAEEPLPPTMLWHGLFGVPEAARRHRAWFEDYRCGRCHAVHESLRGLDAPDLRGLGERLRPEYVYHRLLNPHRLREDTRMPQLFADSPVGRQAAADVTAFLCGVTSSDRPGTQVADDAAAAKFEDLGCIACHSWHGPDASDPYDRMSLHFTREKFTTTSLVQFVKQPQQHFPSIRMPQFRMTDEEAAALATVVLARSTGELPNTPKRARVDRVAGERHFAALRCAACHIGPKPETQAPVAMIPIQSPTAGCLAESPADGKSPRYVFDDMVVTGLRRFISSAEINQQAFALPLAEEAERTIKQLRCTACHHRDNIISPRGEIIAEESDRGLPPETLPNLTFAGEKLHAAAIADIVGGKVKEPQRTWLKARMPAFPFYADAIAHGLAAQHAVQATYQDAPSVAVTEEVLDIGKRLTLTNGGLDCRQCHGIGGQLAAGDEKTQLARGIDFLAVKKRVRYDFYRRFVLDPPRFDIGTRMPKFVTDGRITKVNHIYDGDARQQFDAIWLYLQSLSE